MHPPAFEPSAAHAPVDLGEASSSMPLALDGFAFRDLFDPRRLADLDARFLADLQSADADLARRLVDYRARAGADLGPEALSELLLAAAPHVSRFVGRLFGVERELAALRSEIGARDPLWTMRREFAKKRVLKPGAGAGWTGSLADAHEVASALVAALGGDDGDLELRTARATLALLEVDDVARKVAKAGGAEWTDALRERAVAVREAIARTGAARAALAEVLSAASDGELGALAASVLHAVEASLSARHRDPHDPAHGWASLHVAKNLDPQALVVLRRPDPQRPELFVGPEHELRERDGFALTDRRGDAVEAEREVDYCLYCHGRDKDSCSKGYRDAKSGAVKSNALGVPLEGCPLDEKISEMHVMRRDGDPLAALALVTLDNPTCAGTGHRICNDCMKACVFQKQEPVNIPQIETRVLTEVLELPWGVEIYGLLTRWNPLHATRPVPLPHSGRRVLVVGLGPAGYTLAHHLTREGFGVVAVDGLKIEPLPAGLSDADGAPRPIRDFKALYEELDERVILGFGGVSEYGITVRWDKNFLTLLYVTLSRNPLLRIHGGVRFGGTLTLDDAWQLGFDHVALAAGAGKPTVIPLKNNLARGIRKASDFLMALQLSGAYKKSSLANLQVSLPAVVIGGGLTAIDTATELIAYYPVQIEKTRARWAEVVSALGDERALALFSPREREELERQLAHAEELAAERALAAREGREPRVRDLVDRWGGVTLVYRRALAESPAYRLNHEEVAKSLEEGVRYMEQLAPVEAVLDDDNAVRAVVFKGASGDRVELAARTVCVAAGTSPNITYEKEYVGTFELDARKQYFSAHTATREADGRVTLTRADGDRSEAFFTSYERDGKTVSFYGDNHPHYAGSVVRAMASAKHGYRRVAELFPERESLDPSGQAARDAALAEAFAQLDRQLSARVVAVHRLTDTIVEVVVEAPLAARKFKPGQFYRLQNFERFAPILDGTTLSMEGLALTGAWIDEEKGLLGTIVLEMGASSRLCAALRPGEPVILMGPTGAPTEIEGRGTVLLCGGGLGNAVLFSIARAFKALGARVVYFAGYRRGEDLFKQDEIERYTDEVIWATDAGRAIEPRRPQDRHFRGNIVQAMVAYGKGELGARAHRLSEVERIIAIGSDRMMDAVRQARHGVLAPMLDPRHLAIGSINSPMQCMMKEVCAQCLQKHRDPATGEEHLVFSCFNQDQELDRVDFAHLSERLRTNSLQEKLASAYLTRLLAKHPIAMV